MQRKPIPRTVAWLVAVVSMAAVCRMAVAVCPQTGEAAPSVITLQASKTAPATDAWIVSPNCEVEVMPLLSDGTLELNCCVERIKTLPTDTTAVTIVKNPLSSGADFSTSKKIDYISIVVFSMSLLDNLIIPSTVTSVVLAGAPITTIKSLGLPDGLQSLRLATTEITSLESLPPRLRSLYIRSSQISSIYGAIPDTITSLLFIESPISKIEKVKLPSKLVDFGCSSCGIMTVRGIKWPKTLAKLYLTDNTIRIFEIRESDVAIFNNLVTFDVTTTQSKCKDETATLTKIQSVPVCVISDDRFETVYGSSSSDTSTGSKDTATGTTTRSPGSQSSDDASKSSSSGSSESSAHSRGSWPSGNGSTAGITTSTGSSSSSSRSSINTSRGASHRGSQEEGGAAAKDSKSTEASADKRNTLVVIIVAVIGSLLALVIAVMGYRFVVLSKKKKQADLQHAAITTPSKGPSTIKTTTDGPSSSSSSSSQEYLANDVRNDKALLRFRIDQDRIHLAKQVARGGFGVVFQATYQGHDVAVKQMLPDAWRNDTLLANFMDEIRICSRLEHPKIVTFIGISWSCLRDISVIIEFMAGGDLHAVLHRQQTSRAPSPSDWWYPWGTGSHRSSSNTATTTSSTTTASKSLIAQDIAEAVVYLHSFQPPILHRDLKARNALLDANGNAKLSDFGISREMAVDETMTGEVGTAAWIAPEVLRGERYSEKADIYSFGVLLVELDTCRHPYDQENDQNSSSEAKMHKNNAQLALLVSSGKLRPSPSQDCPKSVQKLVTQCLSQDANARPTAMEVFYALRQMRKGFEVE